MRHPLAAFGALIVGIGMLIWIVVEIAVIGYSNEPPLQAVYLVLGGTITLAALRWLVVAGLPRMRHRTA